MLVMDSDFLSAFLKIDELDLVRDFFNDEILIPRTVFREISATDLIKKLEKEEIKVEDVEMGKLKGNWKDLGQGEIECILLCSKEDLLLMNDKKAGKVAKRNELKPTNILGFLLSLKEKNFIKVERLEKIIPNLEEKDYYQFKKEIKRKLLSKTND